MTKTKERLTVLDPQEIQDVFGLPVFTESERRLFFDLSVDEYILLEAQRLDLPKCYFVLQLGYFKAKRRFFTLNPVDLQSDLDHIQKRYSIEIPKEFRLQKPHRNTLRQHKDLILSLFDYSQLTQDVQVEIQESLHLIARECAYPHSMARYLLREFGKRSIEIPSYRKFQDMISKALMTEEKRLEALIQHKANDHAHTVVQDLMAWDSERETAKLINLFPEMKNFKVASVRAELERHLACMFHVEPLMSLIKSFELSQESIKQYAQEAQFYNYHRLNELKKERMTLIVVCFVYRRFCQANDALAQAFRVLVQKWKNDAKLKAQEQMLQDMNQAEQDTVKAASLLDFFNDKNLKGSVPFKTVREQAFNILSPSEIKLVSKLLAKGFKGSLEYEWAAMCSLYSTHKPQLRRIIKQIDLQVSEGAGLNKAIARLKVELSVLKPFSRIQKPLPKGWIHKGKRRLLCDGDSEAIIPEHWEILLMLRIAKALESSEVWISASDEYRSLEEELIDPAILENRLDVAKLIEKYQLPLHLASADLHIQDLEQRLEPLFQVVNDSINSGENTFFKIKNTKDKPESWHVQYPNKKVDPDNHSPLRQLEPRSIYSVMRFAYGQCEWVKSFSHAKRKYSKSRCEMPALFGTIVAIGTNIGLHKMARISDIGIRDYEHVHLNFLRLETLRNANALLSDAIAATSFLRAVIDSGDIHSSSDGQHHVVQRDTAKAHTLPKYFGLYKGIVIITLLAHFIPINANVIGTHDHESHYTFDLVHNNLSAVQPKIHSTDSHGINSLNFALLDLFGYQFAPRYKSFSSKAQQRLVGFKKPAEYPESFIVKPRRKVSLNKLQSNWKHLLRILFSLAKRQTSQHTLVRKLNALPNNHPLKLAITEYNAIIESIHILRTVHDPEFRQSIQMALNRGEAYHQLQKALPFANRGRLRGGTKKEILMWSECVRLMAQCVVLYNAHILANTLENQNITEEAKDTLLKTSPVSWSHINFYGQYIFREDPNDVMIPDTTEMIEWLLRRQVNA